MADDEPKQAKAKRLADAVRNKLLANADLVARADGKLTIAIYERGSGFDVKLNLTA